MVDDPGREFATLGCNTDMEYAVRKLRSALDAINPDLAPLRNQGLELIRMPGMGHFSGVSGSDCFDVLFALENRVARSLPPDSVLGSRVQYGQTTCSRLQRAFLEFTEQDGSDDMDSVIDFYLTLPDCATYRPSGAA